MYDLHNFFTGLSKVKFSPIEFESPLRLQATKPRRQSDPEERRHTEYHKWGVLEVIPVNERKSFILNEIRLLKGLWKTRIFIAFCSGLDATG